MEKLKFEIEFQDRIFWVYPGYLMFGLFFLFIGSQFLGGTILGLGAISFFPFAWDYLKLKKLKQYCTKGENGSYEIPFSEIKNFHPINPKEYSIETQTGEFRVLPLFVKDFEKVESRIIQKMEAANILKIESQIPFLNMITNLYLIIGLPYFFFDKINLSFGLLIILFFIFNSARSLFLDLVFMNSTNTYFKKNLSIQNEDIISARKNRFGLLNMKTKEKTYRLWSENLNFKRINNYLLKHGHLPIEGEPEYEFSTLKFICFVVFFGLIMMIVTFYGF